MKSRGSGGEGGAGGSATSSSQASSGSTKNLTVTLLSLELAGPPAAPERTPFGAATANAGDVQILFKSYWNIELVNNDNTFGVHNPGFYASVVANTTSELRALP